MKNKIRHSTNIYTFEALVLVKVPLVEPRPVAEAPHGGPRPYEAGERLREPVVGLVLLAVGTADALAPRPRLGDALKLKKKYPLCGRSSGRAVFRLVQQFINLGS